MADRTCSVCGDSIEHRSPRAKYCSAQCRDWQRLHPDEPIPKRGRTCQHCGSNIDHKRLEVRYCSLKCQRRGLGGVDFRPMVDCRGCGTSFRPGHAAQKYCGAHCRQSHHTWLWRQRNPEKYAETKIKSAASVRAGGQRYRSRKRSATVEFFLHSEIFERDGWVCQICDRHVDRALKWPHSLSASLDHVIPISKGGDHSRANVQLAHVICNLRKSARLPGTVVGVNAMEGARVPG